MSRVNRLAHKLVVRRHLFRREALNPGYASEAMGKFDYKIPFTNLFGKNVYRVVVPMKSPMQKDVERAVQGLGFDGIDWPKGEAIKTLPVSEKAPPGTKPKVTRTNLGKVLGRLPNAQTYLNWWSANQVTRGASDYSIVLSRHPLDVLRMSDFKKPTGEAKEYPEITSCHSSWKEHWPSCYNEMKYGGPIAYLVKNKDLESLNPKQIAGKGEIFVDSDRGVPGIRPLSRLRLRRYHNEDDGFDLAVPEMSVYGRPSSDFLDQVTDWARESQAGVIGGKRWRVRDFVRKGGSYMDRGVSDGLLFNQFFKDRLDSESIMVHEVTGKEREAEDDRRRNEIEQMRQNWEGILEHSSVYYDEMDDDGNENQELNFTWSGTTGADLPLSMFVNGKFDPDYDILNRGTGSLRNVLSDNDFYTENEIINNVRGNMVAILLDINDSDGGWGSPDEFEEFCQNVYDNYDKKNDKMRKVVMNWLFDNGFLSPTPARTFFEGSPHFQNFNIEWDDDGLFALAQAEIGHEGPLYGHSEKFEGPVVQQIRGMVLAEINRIIARQKSTSGYLPGFGPEPVREVYDINRFNVKVERGSSLTSGLMPSLKIEFTADDMTSQEEMAETVDLLKIVDRMFPKIIQECRAWFQRFERQHSKYEKEKEEYWNKYKHQYNYKMEPEPSFQFDPRQARRRRRRTTQEIFAPA